VVACCSDLLERVTGRHVHDVERHVAGDVAQHDGPVGGLGLERRRAGVGVVLRGSVSPRASAWATSTSIAMPFSACIMIMAPQSAACLHGPQDLPVVAVEDARVGHEQLEARDALVLDEVRHRLQRLVVDAADDLVEAVVDGAVALGLAVPLGEARVHVLAGALHGEVDDRGDPAPRGARWCRLERVARDVPPKGSSMWVCTSTPPGITYLPVASMTLSQPSTARSSPGAPTATMTSPSIRTRPASVARRRDDRAVLDERDGLSSHGDILSSAVGLAGDEVVVGVGAAVAVELPARCGPRGSCPGRGRGRSARACTGRPPRRRTGPRGSTK
jgi:hypothetical protein